ncbi:endonuclease/exonuclease/phosphatase family protein [Pandoraea sp. XY-2]|uniref:endonuclease/exonuclease/phosphatase family protein n=1 Tax=Pandoraea sp. XY-2 TaxID=2518599 RepID=UPI0026990423
MNSLHIASYNIHKGFSAFNRLRVHELRAGLEGLAPDLVFLQEVQGLHQGHAVRHRNWPVQPQHEFLAGAMWRDHAYGRNVVYEQGHHGNAILSRYPIVRSDNHDITTYSFEKRGMLHCEIAVPGLKQPLHALCVHLSLAGRGRRRQFEMLTERVADAIPADAPLIIAGDFNDWSNQADRLLAERLALTEVFQNRGGVRRAVFRADCRFYDLTAFTHEAFISKGRRFYTGVPGHGFPIIHQSAPDLCRRTPTRR